MMAFDSVEELRIISKDAKLSRMDQAAIAKAADELESAYRTVVNDNFAMNELIARNKSLEDRIRELTARHPWSMSGNFSWTPKL